MSDTPGSTESETDPSGHSESTSKGSDQQQHGHSPTATEISGHVDKAEHNQHSSDDVHSSNSSPHDANSVSTSNTTSQDAMLATTSFAQPTTVLAVRTEEEYSNESGVTRLTSGSASASGDSEEKSKSCIAISEDILLMTRNNESINKIPEEQVKHPHISYIEPQWGGRTTITYSMDVIKKGTVVKTIDLNNKSFYVFGRLPSCDVQMDHPSLSRFHAVLQHCAVPNDQQKVGWYLFDLDTTHGTHINKLQLNPRIYYRVTVGDVLKFAASSRLHVLQGPEDQESSELNITEKIKNVDQVKCLTEVKCQEENMHKCKYTVSVTMDQTTEPADTEFKRPMIGPVRKSSSSLSGGDKCKNKTGKSDISTPDRSDSIGTEKDQASCTDTEKDSNSGEQEPKSIEASHDVLLTSEEQEKCNQSPEGQVKQPALPYIEPKWGGRTELNYSIEMIKNGTVVRTLNLTDKSFYVFGRLQVCDIPMDHPSLSRFHAVLQHCAVPNDRHEIGWYLFDLDTTHGTCINKLQVNPRMYYRVRVGHVIKFAGSSRLHILQGPAEDQEEVSEFSITELKERREAKKRQDELAELLEGEDEEKEEEAEPDRGCTWGMDDDAPVDPESAETPFMDAIPQNEELYLDDPKKTLKGFFEREGYDLPEYQFEEAGHGKHKCIVQVPVDSVTGQPVYAEAIVVGKRKEAVVACALEACRILDRHGLLRKKDHEAKKVKTRSWEDNDYYNSDEDEFLDRTGEIQKKRALRMKRAGKVTQVTETYDSLTTKLAAVDTEMQDINAQLELAQKDIASAEAADLDALDAYMLSIKTGGVDTKTRLALKRRLFDLRKERARLERLVNISKPALLPQTSKFKLGQSRGRIRGHTRKLTSQGPDRLVSAAAHKPTPDTGSPEEDDEEVLPREEEGPLAPVGVHSLEDTPSPAECEEAGAAGHVTLSDQAAPLRQATLSEERSPEPVVTMCTMKTADDTKHGRTKKETEGTQHESTEKTTEETEHGSTMKTTEETQNESTKKTTCEVAVCEAMSRETPVTKTTPEAGTVRQGPLDTPQVKASPLPVKKRSAETQKVTAKKKKSAGLGADYCTDDPDYAVWMPPEGQTGDGKTHLNAKFGY